MPLPDALEQGGKPVLRLFSERKVEILLIGVGDILHFLRQFF
jgi:hypothetical protein